MRQLIERLERLVESSSALPVNEIVRRVRKTLELNIPNFEDSDIGVVADRATGNIGIVIHQLQFQNGLEAIQERFAKVKVMPIGKWADTFSNVDVPGDVYIGNGGQFILVNIVDYK